MFHWTRRMPYWRTWSFLANQNFVRKTIKRYKVVSSPKARFTKKFLWSRGLCFWHPCRKRPPQIWNFFIQNQKRMSNWFIFWKKTLLSESFSLDILNGVLTKPLKTFRQQTGRFWLLAHKSKGFGYCQIFSPEVLGSAGHLKCPPGSSSFSFEVFADAMVAELITLAVPFSKILKFLAKSREKY